MRATWEGPLQKTPGEGALRFSSGPLQGAGAREGAGERGEGKVTGNLGCVSLQRERVGTRRGAWCVQVSVLTERRRPGTAEVNCGGECGGVSGCGGRGERSCVVASFPAAADLERRALRSSCQSQRPSAPSNGPPSPAPDLPTDSPPSLFTCCPLCGGPALPDQFPVSFKKPLRNPPLVPPGWSRSPPGILALSHPCPALSPQVASADWCDSAGAGVGLVLLCTQSPVQARHRGGTEN